MAPLLLNYPPGICHSTSSISSRVKRRYFRACRKEPKTRCRALATKHHRPRGMPAGGGGRPDGPSAPTWPLFSPRHQLGCSGQGHLRDTGMRGVKAPLPPSLPARGEKPVPLPVGDANPGPPRRAALEMAAPSPARPPPVSPQGGPRPQTTAPHSGSGGSGLHRVYRERSGCV